MSGELREMARAILQPLDRVRQVPPGEHRPFLEEAERATVRLRNRLIELKRGQPGNGATREALQRVNVALSLIVGLGNPLGAIPWDYLPQARALVAELAESPDSHPAG